MRRLPADFPLTVLQSRWPEWCLVFSFAPFFPSFMFCLGNSCHAGVGSRSRLLSSIEVSRWQAFEHRHVTTGPNRLKRPLFRKGRGPAMTIAQSLSDLGQESGAGAYVMDYLLAKGIKTMGTLALIATSPEQLQTTLAAPLLAGFTKGSVTINLQDDEKPIAAAVILHFGGTPDRRPLQHLLQ